MPDTVLGFDYGERRVGVAVGQQITGTATPLETIAWREEDGLLAAIDRLVEEWQPDAFVVGIPLTAAGEVQPLTRAARRFAGILGDRFRRAVHHVDERYTSRAADARFRALRAAGAVRRRDGARQDAVAAQMILEQWLAERTP
ncbi:MAG: Holliday junction resolvase RuvX [Planctomycetota bacterium]